MLAKLAALAVRELHSRIIVPVAAEYRKLDSHPACTRPHYDDAPPCDPAGTLSASTERTAQWDLDKRRPITAARQRPEFGIRASGG